MNLELTLAAAETIDGWMTRRELQWLFHAARSLTAAGVWVELGVWKGRSFFTVAMGLKGNSTLIGVDSFTPTVGALPFVPTRDWVRDHFNAVLKGILRLREDLEVEVIELDTAAASQLFPDGSIDVVYFDADHSQQGLARDLSAWIPKVKTNGLLCGHDYGDGFPGVVQAVDEILPWRELVPDTSIWQARNGSRSC